MNPIKPYTVETDPEVIVFINGFKARNTLGYIWLLLNLFKIVRSVKKSAGCFESIPAFSGPFQVVMISYWQNKSYLDEYVKSGVHYSFMSFVYKYPKALSLFNETYQPNKSGKYYNEPSGMAKFKPLKIPIIKKTSKENIG